jgi:ribosomal protein S20
MTADLLENKYSKWYFNFIEDRANRIIPKSNYTEIHHIIPRSLGGTDNKSNLITLTAKEHFFAHLLLSKMFKGVSGIKMSAAANAMKNLNATGKRHICNSNEYSIIRTVQRRIFHTIAKDHDVERKLQGEILSEHTDISKVLERGVCKNCGILPRAINYFKNNKVFYRKMCDSCSRSKSNGPLVPQWIIQGYKKRTACECCGFKAEYKEQLIVSEISSKFSTVCLNCQMAAKLGKPLKIIQLPNLKESLSIRSDF